MSAEPRISCRRRVRGLGVCRLRRESSPAVDVLVYALPDLSPGPYLARWKVLSADGHLTEGAVRFVVEGQ